MQTVSYKLTGAAPHIQHSSRGINSLDPLVQAMKTLSGKRKKTESTTRAMSDLEWVMGLYTDDPIQWTLDGESVSVKGGGRVIIPAINIERMIKEAAKKRKLGKQVESAVFILDDPPLEGAGDVPTMFGDAKFRLVCPVRVGTASVMRTRPIFRSWSVRIQIEYLDDQIDEQTLTEIMVDAGRLVGLSEWRPRNGRFTVEKI